MFTKRNLFKSTKIALAFAAAIGATAALTAPSSVAFGQGFQGPLDSDAYGAQERADIRAGVSSYGPTVALQNGPVISPLASNSDAYGAGERAEIAAAANESFFVASSGTVDHVMAEEEVADTMVGEIDESPAASNTDESPTEDGLLSSDAYGADEASA